MDQARLTTGLLGVCGIGQRVLEAITQIKAFKLVAVADKDTRLASSVAAQYGCKGFDDFRQFVINTQMDCLTVAEGLHRCLEYIRLAISKKVNILKLSPMARGLQEAHELVGLARQSGSRYDALVIPDYAALVSAFCTASRLNDQARPVVVRGQMQLGIGHYPQEVFTWIKDKLLAGGGVVLYEGYGLVERIVMLLGMPQQVFCRLCYDRPGKVATYMAEDAAILVLEFPLGLVIDLLLIRYWDQRPLHLELVAYHPEHTVRLSDRVIQIQDLVGHNVIERFTVDPFEQLKAGLQAYADSLLIDKDQPFEADGQQQLKVMAVIQAAYLSAKTGCPEDPNRLLAHMPG